MNKFFQLKQLLNKEAKKLKVLSKDLIQIKKKNSWCLLNVTLFI